MINVQSFNLDIKKPYLNRLRVVNGDTANQFVITVTDDKEPITLDEDLHKIIAVFTRADGEVYTQDIESGVSFTAAGVVTIDVYSSSFRTGTNKIALQIYMRESESDDEYSLLTTTQEQSFNARASAIPEAGAENAPAQLPMLEQLIADATHAVATCESATIDANQAASGATAAAGSANTAASDANSAASAANSAASAANGAALDAGSATVDANYWAGRARDESISAEGAAARANAAAASAAKKNVYLLRHNATWSGDTATGDIALMTHELASIMNDAVLVTQIANPSDANITATLIETYRNSSDNVVYFRTLRRSDTLHFTAALETNTGHITFGKAKDRELYEVTELDGTVTFWNGIGEVLCYFDLPIYDGSVIDDE